MLTPQEVLVERAAAVMVVRVILVLALLLEPQTQAVAAVVVVVLTPMYRALMAARASSSFATLVHKEGRVAR